MAYLTYSVPTSSCTFSLDSFSVSMEFYNLWKLKKDHLRLESTHREDIEKFATENGFTVKAKDIY